jgi:uncharacterized protein GlcG (DUF336 family)
MPLTLAQAQTILDGVFAKGAELRCRPLAAAVLDAGAHIIAVARQDGAAHGRPDVAIAKAAGALSLGLSSRTIAELAVNAPAAINSVGAICPRGIVPSPGGVIIVDAAGAPLGAVAVSGDTGDHDEICALAGIAAAGLKAQ